MIQVSSQWANGLKQILQNLFCLLSKWMIQESSQWTNGGSLVFHLREEIQVSPSEKIRKHSNSTRFRHFQIRIFHPKISSIISLVSKAYYCRLICQLSSVLNRSLNVLEQGRVEITHNWIMNKRTINCIYYLSSDTFIFICSGEYFLVFLSFCTDPKSIYTYIFMGNTFQIF